MFQQRVAQTIQRLPLDPIDAEMERRPGHRPAGQFGVVQPVGQAAVVRGDTRGRGGVGGGGRVHRPRARWGWFGGRHLGMAMAQNN